MINNLFKIHKLIFCSLLFALLICILNFSLLFIIKFNSFYNLLAFIPFILILLSYFLYIKNIENLNKFLKCILLVFAVILHIINIAFMVLLFGVLSFFTEMNKIDKQYENPAEYTIAKNSINSQYRINHFPNEIPTEAKNIHFYKYCNSWFGSEGMLLEFDIDKKYIENELQTYKFIAIDNIPKNPEYDRGYNIYNHMLAGSNNFDINNFTFYVINNRNNENPSGHHFPYHYGIGVNKEHNRILYYYDCPD